MLISWVVVSLPVFLLMSLIDPLWDYASLIIWWLKPLFERTQLYILSYGIFGNEMTWKAAIKALPNYAFRQLFSSLTWRRISFTRSLDLSLIQLERLSAQQGKKRLAVLHQQTANTATWLTVILVHVETVMMIGIFMIIMMFVPSSIELSWLDLVAEELWLTNIIYYLCVTLVAPYYVASGFMLYINRRIQLEGWDIELSFKEIASSHAQQVLRSGKKVSNASGSDKSVNLPSIALFALCFLGLVLMPRNEAYAQTVVEEEISCLSETCQQVAQAELSILEVFEHPDFHEMQSFSVPKWLDDWDFEKEQEDESKPDIPPFLKSFLMFFASSIEVIIWLTFISILIYLIVRYRSWLAQLLVFSEKEKSERFDMPKTMFGLDLRQDQLPSDIESEALALINKGNYRECLSLLYRATITALLFQYRVPFSSSNTEMECLAISKSHTSKSIFSYFSSLTLSWRELAYGHIEPSREKVEALCRDWNRVLGLSVMKASELSEEHHRE